ncbi:MAG: helix-turn-helix transcriptional regulator [Acidimicrobiia bacterium]
MSSSARIIAEARKRAGLTQAEFARRLGTHQPVVARWERGRTSPSLETVEQAVRAAGFDLTISITPRDDHDIALIRRELAVTPEQRLGSMARAVNALTAMQDAAHA